MWNANPSADRSTLTSPANSLLHQRAVAYNYDSNAILAEPMTSHTGPALLAAYKSIHQTLTLRGLRPKLQRLDNEASTALKQYMLEE